MRPRELIRGVVLTSAAFALAASPVQAKQPREEFCRQQLPGLQGTYTSVFNNPHSGGRQAENRISCYLQSLINGTESGEEITIATYRFLDGDVRHNLWLAVERGVKVKVLLNGSARPRGTDLPIPWKCGQDSSEDGTDSEQFCELKREIGDNRSADSWISYCGAESTHVTDDACIGGYTANYNGKNSRPIMHNKFYLFSRTLGKDNVVVQTTSNLNEHSGPNMFNSALAIAESEKLYQAYRSYFDDLTKERKDNQYYEHNKPTLIDGELKLHFSPRQDGNTPLDYLNRVECGGNNSGGTSDDNRTIIRIAAADIRGATASELAEKLWELDNKGCYVDIVADIIGYGKYEDPRTDPLRRLLKQPTGIYHGPVVREFSSYRRGVHEKNMMIDGFFDGDPDQKVVFTGSLNFNNKSRYANDETWLMIVNDEVHDDFVRNFKDIRKCANLDWQTSAQQNTGTPTHPHEDCRAKR